MNECPCCRYGNDKEPIWWSKAGFTSSLCGLHKQDAREQRRLRNDLRKGRDAIGLGSIRGVRWNP